MSIFLLCPGSSYQPSRTGKIPDRQQISRELDGYLASSWIASPARSVSRPKPSNVLQAPSKVTTARAPAAITRERDLRCGALSLFMFVFSKVDNDFDIGTRSGG